MDSIGMFIAIFVATGVGSNQIPKIMFSKILNFVLHRIFTIGQMAKTTEQSAT